MKMSEKEVDTSNELRVLSLFSGCGGMDLGFEGDFICHRKSISPQSTWVQEVIDKHWVRLQRNRFRTVFANDILKEAQTLGFNIWIDSDMIKTFIIQRVS